MAVANPTFVDACLLGDRRVAPVGPRSVDRLRIRDDEMLTVRVEWIRTLRPRIGLAQLDGFLRKALRMPNQRIPHSQELWHIALGDIDVVSAIR